jgi:hypothetical protein
MRQEDAVYVRPRKYWLEKMMYISIQNLRKFGTMVLLWTIATSGFSQPAERFLGGAGQGYTMSDTGLDGVVLPVTWTRFTADQTEHGVVLEWTTSEETDNDYFAVQRAIDGINFETIAQVPGAGTTSTERTYRKVDPRPMPGINYYRIRQVDYDGQSSDSDIRPVVYDPEGKNMRILCLVNGHLYPVYMEKTEGPVQFSLVNMMGQVLYQKHLTLQTNYTGIAASVQSQLPTGIYQLVFTGNTTTAGRKILVQ